MQQICFGCNFSWAEHKRLRLFPLYASPITLKYCSEICLNRCYWALLLCWDHPGSSHKCGVSSRWLDGVTIAQVCLKKPTTQRPLQNVQFYQAAQCRRRPKFWGSLQLACWRQECPPKPLPVNWMPKKKPFLKAFQGNWHIQPAKSF